MKIPPSAARFRTCALAAWSLTELLVVMAIIAVLMTLFVSIAYNKIRMKTERALCRQQMSTIHTALNNCLIDQGHWPQFPFEKIKEGTGENEVHKYWITTLLPWGGPKPEGWLCPTEKRLRAGEKKEDRDEYESSYLVTPFDEQQETPKAYHQPWVMERGDFHGEGNIMLMENGHEEAIDPMTTK